MSEQGGRTVAEWEASGEPVVFVKCASGHVVAGFHRIPHPRHPLGVWRVLRSGALDPRRRPDPGDVEAFLDGGKPRTDDLASSLRLYAQNGYARGVPSASRVSTHLDLRCAECGHSRGPRWPDDELWAVFDRLAAAGLTTISARDLADRDRLMRRLGVSFRGRSGEGG